MANMNSISIASYNCKHFKDAGLKYYEDILKKANIIFLQEHCLYEKQFSNFYAVGDIGFIGVSAMDDSVLRLGRPFGGCAILWKNELNCSFKKIECYTSRICAAICTLANGLNILVINTYLPCDDRYQSENYYELADILGKLICLIQDHRYDAVIVGGDLNCDFTRRTPHVSAVREFIAAADLSLCTSHSIAEVDYTFECKASGHFSLIDHFIGSKNLYNNL